jgi:2,4-diketo-3-deoxy-L-fuconate hydrolase
VRFVSFVRAGCTLPGIIEDGTVRVIAAPSLRSYVALVPAERQAAHSDERIDLAGVQLVAPIVPSRNVFCVGRNYLEHAREGAAVFGKELKLPNVPTFFTKAPTAIIGPDADLHLEAGISSEYDYEAELAVVIGTRCKDVSLADAPATVFGYTCLNDVTARDLQRAHGQWFKGKSLDDCCPIGPWIVSADEIPNPGALTIGLRLNGAPRQLSSTAKMIFNVARLIAELSKGMTLLPGDVIATGTPEGVGFARTPPEFLRDGDTMEVEIEKVGVLRNRVRIS